MGCDDEFSGDGYSRVLLSKPPLRYTPQYLIKFQAISPDFKRKSLPQ